MEFFWLIIAAVSGVLVGGVIIWLISRSHSKMLHERLVAVQQELVNAQSDLNQKNDKIAELNQSIVRLETTLVHERRVSGEKVAILDDATQKLSNAFKALSAEALKSNIQQFKFLTSRQFCTNYSKEQHPITKRQKAVEN